MREPKEIRRIDIHWLRDAYRKGQNISLLLRTVPHENTAEAIELAYDLQAGSYVRRVGEDPTQTLRYVQEMHHRLEPHLFSDDVVLDCGTGELTTLSFLSAHLPETLKLLAFDISLSRVRVGRRFAESAMPTNLFRRLQTFVADMERIPLPDDSVDVVITSHALEPNRGREKNLLTDLFRVARRKIVLFEPTCEKNSIEGRARMDALGYVRGLPDHIKACGGNLLSIELLKNVANPLNPTCCYVVGTGKEGVKGVAQKYGYSCPISGSILKRFHGYSWSEEGGVCLSRD